ILWWKRMPINRSRLLKIVPFFLIGLGMGLLTIWWERHHVGTRGEVFSIGLVNRILIASRAIWFYAGKLLWPTNLTFSYPRWNIDHTNAVAYSWLVACVVTGLLIGYARRWLGRGPETALGFYVATLGPVLGFIMLYTFRYTFVADHYQYVA